jgi:hypothetical protein
LLIVIIGSMAAIVLLAATLRVVRDEEPAFEAAAPTQEQALDECVSQ